jgi:hypothetical protein
MDEFEGLGGSYTVDPKTGKRILNERTKEPDAPEAAEPTETTQEATE